MEDVLKWKNTNSKMYLSVLIQISDEFLENFVNLWSIMVQNICFSDLGQDSRPQRVVLVEVPEGCIIMVMHYLVYLKSLELLGLTTQSKNVLLIWW